ncbi:hypothetical protein B0H21DRAFT_819141 [Amylocystis lapponica]|nr:hypothetical protein B0H21DRAFT_819141 [Amylocystis lapponica]
MPNSTPSLTRQPVPTVLPVSMRTRPDDALLDVRVIADIHAQQHCVLLDHVALHGRANGCVCADEGIELDLPNLSFTPHGPPPPPPNDIRPAPLHGADEDVDRLYCKIEYSTCFGEPSELGSASEVFKHIAFACPECGDCVITVLVRASGPLGVSAFLPPTDCVLGTLAGRAPVRALLCPRTSPAERSVCAWTLALLLRYHYVLGNTLTLFERMQSARQAAEVLQHIEAHPDVTLLCVNNDDASDHTRVAGMLPPCPR